MQVGYFAMPLHPPGSDFTKTVHDDLAQIVALDKLGYSEAWIGEHFTTVWENIPAPELFIAQALAMTKNIKLGTGVTCMPNHNPFHIAHRIAQLDHQAKGRFMWGIGSGATLLDFKAFGIDYANNEQRPLTRENLDMVLKIWDGLKPGTYENKFWKFTMPEPMEDLGFWVHMKPYQKPYPPIAVAGLSPKSDTLIMAGQRDWIPMSINYVPTVSLKTHWDVYEEASRGAGNVPDRKRWRIAREVFVADTTEEARDVALHGVLARDFNDYFMPALTKYKLLHFLKSDPSTPDSALNAEYMADNIWLVGSAEDVAKKLRKLYKDVGGFGTLLAMAHEWKPEKNWRRSMELLAKEVIPSLSDLK
ncbi:MAG: LLM class flavin-dependent oxidoreductase [SAR202 cluster bacterium]|nr:LLM class flavin-dependent oxidoreductase [SAR202 cluster bacterium]